MQSAWQLSDIIDLEYFISKDKTLYAEAGEDILKKRDRKIFLEEIAPKTGKSSLNDTRLILKKWLDARRRKISGADSTVPSLPGQAWNELYTIFAWLLFIAGLTGGAGLTFSLLSYSGATPINVFLYLAALIFPQAVMLLLAASLYAGRKILRRHLSTSLPAALLSRLFSFSAKWISNHAWTTLNAEQRMNIQALTGIIKEKKQVYHDLFILPFFILLQLTGIGFNAGALGATLLKIAGSDMAFGWQSTLHVSAETISAIVQALALPWSWFVPPGIAFPDLTQIQGSRLILKDGILLLTTPDLVSWWPFLCLALLFYGLIPRLILFIAGRFRLTRSLDSLDFNADDFREIIRRMLVPGLACAGHSRETDITGGQEATIKCEMTGNYKAGSVCGTLHNKTAPCNRALVLIPEELMNNMQSDILSGLLEQRTGLKQQGLVPVDDACDYANESCGEKLRGMLSADSDIDALVCIREAWQPPIEETLAFFRNLRIIAGSGRRIIVAMVGMPLKDTMFTPSDKEDMNIWQQKLKAIGDPNLKIMELVRT